MGEYVKYKGTIRKIGTCEDLYYTSHALFSKKIGFMKKCDGGDIPSAYLNPGNRFRFPFPDEDHLDICKMDQWNRGLTLTLNRDEFVNALFPLSVKWPDVQLQGGKTEPNPNNEGESVTIELIQQKVMENGRLAPVYRCPYSGEKWRIEGDEEIINFCLAILKNADGKNQPATPFFMEVARRVYRGWTKEDKPIASELTTVTAN